MLLVVVWWERQRAVIVSYALQVAMDHEGYGMIECRLRRQIFESERESGKRDRRKERRVKTSSVLSHHCGRFINCVDTMRQVWIRALETSGPKAIVQSIIRDR